MFSCPDENIFRFISCQCGHLWLRASDTPTLESISSKNPSLGAEPHANFIGMEHSWEPGDVLTFYASLGSQQPGKDLFLTQEQLQSYYDESPKDSAQRQANSYLRKVKIKLNRPQEERSVIFLSIIRKN